MSSEFPRALSFPKSMRLNSPSEFSNVFDAPSFKIHHPDFLILARFNELPHSRLGLVVAKKNIRLATQRNNTKRRIRETFRYKQHNLPSIDVIVLPRRGCDKLSNHQLTETLLDLWNRAAKKAKKANATLC